LVTPPFDVISRGLLLVIEVIANSFWLRDLILLRFSKNIEIRAAKEARKHFLNQQKKNHHVKINIFIEQKRQSKQKKK
jgi:hypothetical protein